MGDVKVIRRSYTGKKGQSALYAMFYLQRNKMMIPLGVSATASEWSGTDQLRGRSKETKDKNLIIQAKLSRISNIFVKARLRDEKLTKESFLRQYNSPDDFDSFISYMEHYRKKQWHSISYNTLRSYNTIIKKVSEWRPGLSFAEVNLQTLKEFLFHLRKSGNSDATAWKNLALLKVFVMAAERDGYITDNPFHHIKVLKPKAKIIYLEEKELSKLWELYRSNTLAECHQTVLRFFLFMTLTSLHVGDAKRLEIENIKGSELHYVRQKTHAKVVVPLSETAKRMCDYYINERTRGTLIVGLPCEQDINRIIKKICAMVGITKSISCKAARHTFATLFYDKTRNLVALRDILGHSSINMTMRYAHAVDASKNRDIRFFDDIL